MEKLGLGVIGCGLAADILYGPAFQHMEKGRLVAAMDISEERARLLQSRHGVEKIYADLDGILGDKDVDAVVVLTPPHRHVESVIAAAVAGKHVYCEKPMATTVDEADEMISACKSNGVKLMIAFMKRFNRSFQLVKSLLTEGRLGQVFEMRVRWDSIRTGAPTGEKYLPESGGGILQEDGSHVIDICRWWLGDICEVSAQILIASPENHPTEDVGCLVMKHDSGAMSTLHATMLTHATGEESYELFGTQGTLVMRWLNHSTQTLEPAQLALYENGNMKTDLTLDGIWHPDQRIQEDWQYLRQLEHFCGKVLNGEEPHPTGSNGKSAVEIVNAAYLSSWEEKKVRLPLKKTPNTQKIFAHLRQHSPWSLKGNTWSSRYGRRR